VILATGASDDRRLGIPGEDLKGIQAARTFVGWYNGDPRCISMAEDFNLEAENSVVIGHGNVALDAARMLAQSESALNSTDAPSHVIRALSSSAKFRQSIWLLGRRGPAQATFTTKELRELTTQVSSARVVCSPRDLELDAVSTQDLGSDRIKSRKFDLLKSVTSIDYDVESDSPLAKAFGLPVLKPSSLISSQSIPHFLRIAFNWRPHAFISNPLKPGWVGGIELRRQKLEGPLGRQVAVDDSSSPISKCILPAQLVLRSIGYRAVAIPGVPFDAAKSMIPTSGCRVLKSSADQASVEIGVYATGWARRGPVGIIGSNITDAQQTVDTIAQDMQTPALASVCVDTLCHILPLLCLYFSSFVSFVNVSILALQIQVPPADQASSTIASTLKSRGVTFVDWAGWLKIDAQEKTRAKPPKPREKIINSAEMLSIALS
jgi:hypothetical protein